MTTPALSVNDTAIAKMNFYSELEAGTEKYYAEQAEEHPVLHEFATEKAAGQMAVLTEIDTSGHMSRDLMNKGFYRMFFSYTDVDDSDAYVTLGEHTIGDAFRVVTLMCNEDLARTSHEWSLAAMMMKVCIEDENGGSLFSQPDTRFASAFIVYIQQGLAEGMFFEVDK